MELSEQKIKGYIKRLLLSRLRLLCNNGFFGMLLMHVGFGLDENCETAYTNGRKICFGPQFLDSLNDTELDFVLMHEVMHIALRHCARGTNLEPERFNIACDIVVNSNILLSNNMDENSITLRKYGTSVHLAPNGKEGFEYTAEQVYEMLPPMPANAKKMVSGDIDRWDDHEQWGEPMEEYEKEEWEQWLRTASELISIRESTKSFGGPALMAQRLLKRMNRADIDWRTILNEFIQEEINDYSFSPPDRRFSDSPFFLPDFNEKDEKIKNIWFLIDTSGSISDKAIDAAYAEICSAIEQFGGKFEGILSFTECFVTDPIPFCSTDELMAIKPIGGGGNDFSAIFRYMQENMQDNLPSQIIIITDGYDNFPKESAAMGVPVLWLINNEDAQPPWGKIARIKV
ncbi:MAG: hypothetical protein IIX54_04455 [Clostridia bacterium]|nr:hypothetical protein [Clostridia bacterium]